MGHKREVGASIAVIGDLTPRRVFHNLQPSIKGMGFPKTACPG
jgi:hypothetical protein